MVLAAKAAILAEDEKRFTLDQVNGDLKITKVLTLAPFETAKVLTQSKVKNHRKRVNAHDVVTKTVVAQLSGANVVPPKLGPKVEKETENTDQETIDRTPLSEEKMEELFNKLDLSGMENWEETEKREMEALIREYSFLFALDDLDFGKTSIVKHKIRLVNNEPFKE